MKSSVRVIQVGGNVSRFKVGDSVVGVGCMVDSCQHCASCEKGDEQYCEHGATFTTTVSYPQMTRCQPMVDTRRKIVVSEKFVLKFPNGFGSKRSRAVTVRRNYHLVTLRHWKQAKAAKFAVIGLGDLDIWRSNWLKL